MNMLNVVYYVRSADGTSPIKEDLEKIKKDSIKAKIKAAIAHVAERNGRASYVISKNIRGFHFSEIRIKFPRNLYRVLYFIWRDRKLILLHMFVKQEGEETPVKELSAAEKRYADFISHANSY